jgi:hypothetical protein
MSETGSYLYGTGAFVGGIVLTSVSASGMWLLEGKKPTVKTLGRDFLLGAILFFVLLQLVPESTMALLTGIVAFMPKMSTGDASATDSATIFASASDTASSIAETANSIVEAMSDEVEVKVGVPRF